MDVRQKSYFMTGLLSPLLYVAISVFFFPLTAWSAYVAMLLWNWFPAVYFHLHPISFWMMVGFMYVVGALQGRRCVKGQEMDWSQYLIVNTLGYLILLGFEYAIHLKIQ